MTRLPLIFSFILFLAIAATLAYWIPQWIAPPPRAVAAAANNAPTRPPVSAAAHLFGGPSQSASVANVQLRGVVHAGRASDSVAIIVVEGKPPRALRVNSEIAPGMTVKQILSRTVVVSEKNAERELSLPAFAAQESTATAPPPSLPSSATTPTPANALPSNPPAMTGISPTGSSGGSGTRVQDSSGAQAGGMTSLPSERAKTQMQGGSGITPPSEPGRPPSHQ